MSEMHEVWVMVDQEGYPVRSALRAERVRPSAPQAQQGYTVVRYVPESAQPAERDGEWVSGNGAGLPNGTEAWVAWKTRDGYGVTWTYRRDGGWGSDGTERESLEGPAFADEPRWPGHVPIVFYMLSKKPLPPPQPKEKP